VLGGCVPVALVVVVVMTAVAPGRAVLVRELLLVGEDVCLHRFSRRRLRYRRIDGI
jgi:hypothetical protein